MKLFLKEQLKVLLAQEGLKIKELAELISEQKGSKYSAAALSQKINRGTMTYNEAINIADILGYEIKFEKKEK